MTLGDANNPIVGRIVLTPAPILMVCTACGGVAYISGRNGPTCYPCNSSAAQSAAEKIRADGD